MPPRTDTATDALADAQVIETVKRGIVEIKGDQITYNLGTKKTYNWTDPEEWVRPRTIAFLIAARGYPANRIRTEVSVPRRTPGDFADVVVYHDDRCREPYLVVENKAAGQPDKA
jgi:type I restriction enzyme M protein